MPSPFSRLKSAFQSSTRLGIESLEDRCTPATFTVSNLNDAGAGSLREAIVQANASLGEDQIVVAPGVAGTITLTSGQLSITDDVNIVGPGNSSLVVNGNAVSRVFFVDPGLPTADVAMSGIVVTGGAVVGSGGGIFVQSGILRLTDVSVSDNRASDAGGGIAAGTGTTLNLLRTLVTGNAITGGMGVGGGVVVNGAFDIDTSVISSNNAGTGGFGGGLAVATSLTPIVGTVENTTIAGNLAGNVGGGIYLDLGGLASSVTVTNSTISGNATAGDGGGAFLTDGAVAATLNFRNSTIAYNSAGTDGTGVGGGVRIADGGSALQVVSIDNTIVSNNVDQGGANDLVRNLGSTLNASYSLFQATPAAGAINGTNVSNLTNADPKLGPLANNGGYGQTHLLRFGSAAIDAGNPLFVPPPTTDQRGLPRVIRGRLDMGAVEVNQVLPTLVATGAGSGGSAVVTAIDPTGTQSAPFNAFPGFTGGVRVATADVTGDGILDYIVGAGPGGAPIVQIFDGNGLGVVASFAAFEGSFSGGVYVAAGDINGDGFADIVVTPDQGGGPVVAVYSGFAASTGVATELIPRYFGIQDPAFRGGARAAVGDVNGDGVPDIVVSAGFLGGPRITIWDGVQVLAGNTGATAVPLANFFAFEDTLRNGAFVAVGDVTGDGLSDLMFGGGPGGSPRVRIADAAQVLAAGNFGSLDNLLPAVVANFFSGPDTNRGGVRVATADLDGDAFADLVTGAGDFNGTAVTAYRGSTIATAAPPPALFGLDAYPGFSNGVYVG